jgi:beta-lactamase superfamily II metal-dependent hydrolase
VGANSIRSCLITKLDASHLGGLPIVRKEIPVREVLVASTLSHSQIAKGILSSVNSHTVFPGKPISLSKRVSAELLTTGDKGPPAIRIQLSESRILLLPLADQELISSLSVVSDDSLHADVLMMPLGGAELASTLALIARIAPKAVITQVELFKQNGVPSGEWERLLAEKDIKLFRQDKSGALFIESAAEGTSVKPFLDNSNLNR